MYLNSLVRQKEGRKEERKASRNSDARRGRSHRSNSIRGVECEEQEKTWTVVWSYPLTIGMERATESRTKM